jgi:hypothetical protein
VNPSALICVNLCRQVHFYFRSDDNTLLTGALADRNRCVRWWHTRGMVSFDLRAGRNFNLAKLETRRDLERY